MASSTRKREKGKDGWQVIIVLVGWARPTSLHSRHLAFSPLFSPRRNCGLCLRAERVQFEMKIAQINCWSGVACYMGSNK